MDKETLSHYGWIVICVLVLAVMLALATPFGSFVSKSVDNTLKGFIDTNDNALYTVARPPIEDPDENTTITAIGDTFNPQIGKTLQDKQTLSSNTLSLNNKFACFEKESSPFITLPILLLGFPKYSRQG